MEEVNIRPLLYNLSINNIKKNLERNNIKEAQYYLKIMDNIDPENKLIKVAFRLYQMLIELEKQGIEQEKKKIIII